MSYLREYNGSEVRYADFVWIVQLKAVATSLACLTAGYINSSCKISMKLIVITGCILNVGSIAVTYFTLQHSLGFVIGKQ